MRIDRISIRKDSKRKFLEFSPGSNLIFSSVNSCGKTTLFRFILHGMGFTIPSLKGLNMDECFVKMGVHRDDGTDIEIRRYGKDLTIIQDGSPSSFRLPRQLEDAVSVIFGTGASDICPFILGSMYIDQDKGWSLLNHGKVIGKNRFFIDHFLTTLCSDEVSKIQFKKDSLKSESKRYKELLNLFDRQKTLDNISRNDVDTTVVESLQGDINKLNVQLAQLNKEYSRVEGSKKNNKEFKNYIDRLRLYINVGGEHPIRLTSDMIEPIDDITNLLEARSSSLKKKIKELRNQLLIKEAKLDEYIEKQGMDAIVESFSVTPLSKINLDVSNVQSSIKLMDKAIKQCDSEIDSAINISRPTVRLNEIIMRNAAFLGVDSYLIGVDNVCRIRELKVYSGTDYKKTVLAFRLAYCSLIREEFGIMLPLILDSPRNEVDDQNMSMMMGLIREHYSDHQILIASIFDTGLGFDKKIELKVKNKLLDEDVNSKIADFL